MVSLWQILSAMSIYLTPQGTEVYKIDNVTESDAGVYACVVGTDVAHAHLVAHLEVREEAVPFAPLPGDSKGLGIIAGTLSVLAFLLFVLTLYIFRRCRMERFKKQQAIRVSPFSCQISGNVSVTLKVGAHNPKPNNMEISCGVGGT